MNKDCGCVQKPLTGATHLVQPTYIDHDACRYREIVARGGEDRRIFERKPFFPPNMRITTQDRREVVAKIKDLRELLESCGYQRDEEHADVERLKAELADEKVEWVQVSGELDNCHRDYLALQSKLSALEKVAGELKESGLLLLRSLRQSQNYFHSQEICLFEEALAHYREWEKQK